MPDTELKKRLDKAEGIASRARVRFSNLQVEYEKEEVTPSLNKLIGNCYKSDNGYNLEERWWKYHMVTKISKTSFGLYPGVITFTFEVCSDGRISISPEEESFNHGASGDSQFGSKITKREFNRAYKRMMAKIEMPKI